jgi:hypothetical protein
MNDIELFDNDIYDLLSLIVERNKLAKIRSSKRGKLHRLKQSRYKAIRHQMSAKAIDRLLAVAYSEYLQSCNNLAVFTKNNKEFRSKMRKKYGTIQKNDASNEVAYIKLKPNNSSDYVVFFKKDFETIVTENEVNNILLGAPLI